MSHSRSRRSLPPPRPPSTPPSPLSPVSNPTCPTRTDHGQQRVGDCYHTYLVSSLPSQSSSHLSNPSPLSPSLHLGASLHSDSGMSRRETEPPSRRAYL